MDYIEELMALREHAIDKGMNNVVQQIEASALSVMWWNFRQRFHGIGLELDGLQEEVSSLDDQRIGRCTTKYEVSENQGQHAPQAYVVESAICKMMDIEKTLVGELKKKKALLRFAKNHGRGEFSLPLLRKMAEEIGEEPPSQPKPMDTSPNGSLRKETKFPYGYASHGGNGAHH